jgi:hypothetical protein
MSRLGQQQTFRNRDVRFTPESGQLCRRCALKAARRMTHFRTSVLHLRMVLHPFRWSTAPYVS